MSAQQAVSLVKDRTVVIVPTKTVAQGISAILAFEGSVDIKGNLEKMEQVISKVKTGQVTFAARDSEFGGFKIKEGEILSLADGKLKFTGKDPIKAAEKLTKSLIDKNTEFVTLIYGENISESQAEGLKESLEASIGSSVEINLIKGEQPIYYFIVSVE